MNDLVLTKAGLIRPGDSVKGTSGATLRVVEVERFLSSPDRYSAVRLSFADGTDLVVPIEERIVRKPRRKRYGR